MDNVYWEIVSCSSPVSELGVEVCTSINVPNLRRDDGVACVCKMGFRRMIWNSSEWFGNESYGVWGPVFCLVASLCSI
jgi:hypothetical protein